MPETEGLLLGGQALPHHPGRARVIGQEVAGDAVQRQVQDAAVGVLFQDGEMPAQGGHQAAGFHGLGRVIQPHREPARADHPALDPAVVLDPPLLRERREQRVGGPHLRAAPLEPRGPHVFIHDQQAAGGERPGDQPHRLLQMAEVVQRVQREHHVAAAFRLPQRLAGVGHVEAQHIVQARLLGEGGGALGLLRGDVHAGDVRESTQPHPLHLAVTGPASQRQGPEPCAGPGGRPPGTPRPAGAGLGQPAAGHMPGEGGLPAERVPAPAYRRYVVPLHLPRRVAGR